MGTEAWLGLGGECGILEDAQECWTDWLGAVTGMLRKEEVRISRKSENQEETAALQSRLSAEFLVCPRLHPTGWPWDSATLATEGLGECWSPGCDVIWCEDCPWRGWCQVELTLSFGEWQHLEVGTWERSHEGRAESGSQQEGRRDEERSRGRGVEGSQSTGRTGSPTCLWPGNRQSCLPSCEADWREDPKQGSDLLKGSVLSPQPWERCHNIFLFSSRGLKGTWESESWYLQPRRPLENQYLESNREKSTNQ